MTTPEQARRNEAVKVALAAWNALPHDVRNGERPFIMGFNAGWDEAVQQYRPGGDEVERAIEWLAKNADTITSAVRGWHRQNSASLSSWMREDERDWRADLELHLSKLSTPPADQPEGGE